MNVDLIFKIAAIGIIVAILNQVLIKSERQEQAMMTTLAGLIVVLMMPIVPGLSTLPQPTSTLSPRKAPIFLIPVSILVLLHLVQYRYP